MRFLAMQLQTQRQVVLLTVVYQLVLLLSNVAVIALPMDLASFGEGLPEVERWLRQEDAPKMSEILHDLDLTQTQNLHHAMNYFGHYGYVHPSAQHAPPHQIVDPDMDFDPNAFLNLDVVPSGSREHSFSGGAEDVSLNSANSHPPSPSSPTIAILPTESTSETSSVSEASYSVARQAIRERIRKFKIPSGAKGFVSGKAKFGPAYDAKELFVRTLLAKDPGAELNKVLKETIQLQMLDLSGFTLWKEDHPLREQLLIKPLFAKNSDEAYLIADAAGIREMLQNQKQIPPAALKDGEVALILLVGPRPAKHALFGLVRPETLIADWWPRENPRPRKNQP